MKDLCTEMLNDSNLLLQIICFLIFLEENNKITACRHRQHNLQQRQPPWQTGIQQAFFTTDQRAVILSHLVRDWHSTDILEDLLVVMQKLSTMNLPLHQHQLFNTITTLLQVAVAMANQILAGHQRIHQSRGCQCRLRILQFLV